MSKRAVEFLEEWVSENMVKPVAGAPEGDDSEARLRAEECVIAAKEEGIAKEDIEEEVGDLARIMQKEEKFYDGCGNKRAIHVANRCRDKLHRVSAERHSRHDRRYAASLRPSICPAQETHNRF